MKGWGAAGLMLLGIGIGWLVASKFWPVASALGKPEVGGKISLNQTFIEDVRSEPVDLANVQEVFDYVFSALPEEVDVYPTENYYYWRFFAAGQEVAGNIRLDPEDRDRGVVNFGYFSRHNRPERPEDFESLSKFEKLGPEQGVSVVKREELAYDIAYGGKTVRFRLHDVPQTRPLNLPLLPGETFMARTFDESGFQFILLYDETSPRFRFVLDEAASLPDTFTEIGPAVLAGRLSGFVFYTDSLERKILFGVDSDNIRRNNYFDGPFDQLADNFVAGERLREAMEAAYPYARGQLNERGVFLAETGESTGSRLAITPYHTYASLGELGALYQRCAAASEEPEVIRCLTADPKQNSR